MISKALIWLVKIYQLTLSPLIGGGCRYTPSCSQYMIEAIDVWGPAKGIWMGLRRISRCAPWGGHGHDPVPKKIPAK
jgi:putative membrane protein insertion efficiency factor